MKRLRFRGEEFILVADDDATDGAIATVAEYESFTLNRYHLMENGDIMSFGEVVGNVNEIEWLEGTYD